MNNTISWRPTGAEEFARFLALYTAVVASEHLQVSEKVALIEDAATEFLARELPHHIRAIVKRLADNPWRKTGGAKPQGCLLSAAELERLALAAAS